MKINLEWLRDHIDLKDEVDIFKISEILTNIGLEVEPLFFNPNSFDNIVVGKILEAKSHPNADKLQVCRVTDGVDEFQIVCGAPNARVGIKVALAKIGTNIINGDFKIRKSKIRDIESQGMMCSERELCLSEEHDGIIEMNESAIIGNNFASEYNVFEFLPIEISLTPNRGDAASVYGIARDLAVVGLGNLKKMEKFSLKEEYKSDFNVKNIQFGFFTGQEIRDIKNSTTPKWIQKRLALQGCGLNSCVVDILNYIMFDLGQPMHAYDSNKIGRNIFVNIAKNVDFIDLNCKNLKLDHDILTVQDENNDISIAGIIGGENSAIDDTTTNLFIESAYFPKEKVACGSKKLKIVSDARFRFERGINPELVEIARLQACKMIQEYCGGKISTAVGELLKLEKKKIILHSEKVASLLGYSLSDEIIINILEKLQFKIQKNDKIMEVLCPLFRHDCILEEDLIEEIARINGFNKIKSIPFLHLQSRKNIEFENSIKLKKMLSSNGFLETVSMSFIDSKKAKLFGTLNEDLFVLNPIHNMDYMRNSLLPNLLGTIQNNWSVETEKLSFFEYGKIFKGCKKNEQHNIVSGVICQENDSMMEIKKVLYQCLKIFDINIDKLSILEFLNCNYAHPNKTFECKFNGNIIAVFGEIHPLIQDQFDIKYKISFFELFLNNLLTNNSLKYFKSFILNKQQSIVREFSFIVSEDIKISEILYAYKNDMIIDVKLLDIYRDKSIGLDKKSVSIRFVLKPKEDFKNIDIDDISNNIINNIQKKTNGILRDGVKN